MFIGVLSCAALADNLPEPTLPAGVGVHFNEIYLKDINDEKDLEMIAAAGFRLVREDFRWDKIERNRGEYDWSEYDRIAAGLERHGLRPYFILCYSNPLYEQAVTNLNPAGGGANRVTLSPQHLESIAAYARWAAAAAEHFHGQRVIWEIWNEPNGVSFWKPKPDAAQYTALALAAAKAIRTTDPQACLVAPATALFPWDFLETVFKSGLLEYLDAVSVHPYRDKLPETAAADFKRLHELIKQYSPEGKTIPIIDGEWGYSANTKGVSPETQAAFAARQQLSDVLNEVPISIWYDWKNDGENPAERQHNFGTVTHDLKPKPAYLAIQSLTRELSGYRMARRWNTGNENDFVLAFTNALGKTKLAAWTTGAPRSAILDSKLTLDLDSMPKYVSPGNFIEK